MTTEKDPWKGDKPKAKRPNVGVTETELRERYASTPLSPKQKDEFVDMVLAELPPMQESAAVECVTWSLGHSNAYANTSSFVVGNQLQGTLCGIVTRVTLMHSGLVRVQVLASGKFRYLWLMEGSGY